MNIQPASAAVAQAVTGTPPRPEAPEAPRETKRSSSAELQKKAEQEREVSRADVAEAAARVEKFVDSFASQLQFSVDESSGTRVVTVIDRTTSEVIRQIPSEEMLQIAKALDRLQGLLVRQQA